MKQKKYNHLFKVPNTDEGRAFIAQLKHYMKDTESRHRIRLKGRNPIVGAKAYNGGCDGGVRLAEAKNIAIYLKEDTNSYNKGYENARDYWFHKGVEEGARVVERNQQYQQGYREGRQDLLEYLQTVINTERLHNEQ